MPHLHCHCRRTGGLLALLVLALGACQTSRPTTTAAPSARAEIDRVLTAAYADFSAAYRQASAPDAAALYSEDAVYVEPGVEPVRGRPAIEAVFRQFLGSYSPGAGPEIRFAISDRRVRDDVVVDVGTFAFGDAAAAARFVVVWCREADTVWRICTDAYSPLRRPSAPSPPGQ